MDILEEISVQLQTGKATLVKQLIAFAVEKGFSAKDILEKSLLQGMSVIAEKFKNAEVFVPEILVAARSMNMGIDMLKPLLQKADIKATGKVCIGSVEGDLHDIGKNLVCIMMEGKGIEVIDLGTDVSPDVFVQAAKENECQVICCSALLTTTMQVMKDVVKAVKSAGLRDKIKIMIGGAPITQTFCEHIGADCYTPDATTAAEQALILCQTVRC
jgi:corrinoid protein of di/trimethylamine methyltransferase